MRAYFESYWRNFHTAEPAGGLSYGGERFDTFQPTGLCKWINTSLHEGLLRWSGVVSRVERFLIGQFSFISAYAFAARALHRLPKGLHTPKPCFTVLARTHISDCTGYAFPHHASSTDWTMLRHDAVGDVGACRKNPWR